MEFIRKNIISVAVVVLVLLGGGFFYLNQNKPETKSTTNTTQEKKVVTTVTIKIDGTENKYDVEDVVGKTALEATEKVVTTEKTGEGKDAFITSINGRVADDSKHEFWKLVINGQDAQVGAGSYTIAESDTIVWEIDTY